MSATEVYSILSGHTPLTDIVGTGIYPGVRPQGTSLPATRYKFVGGRPENKLDGGAEIDNRDVQVDGYSTDYDEALDVFNKARDAMEAAGYYLVSGPLDFYDEDSKIFQYSGDFSIWV